MAKKKGKGAESKVAVAAAPAAPVAPVRAYQAIATEVLLDWRLNLILICVAEIIILGLFVPREIQRTRTTEALEALWTENYDRAYELFRWLENREPDNVGFIKAMGDVALGQGKLDVARQYYERALQARLNTPDMKIQIALLYQGLARRERDPKLRDQYVNGSRQMVEQAHQEAPEDLKTNYWMGRFRLAEGKSLEAAGYFANVRLDYIPSFVKPTLEQRRLYKEAREALESLGKSLMGPGDYHLDARNLKVDAMPLLPLAPSPTTGTAPSTPPVTLRTPARPTTPPPTPSARPVTTPATPQTSSPSPAATPTTGAK